MAAKHRDWRGYLALFALAWQSSQSAAAASMLRRSTLGDQRAESQGEAQLLSLEQVAAGVCSDVNLTANSTCFITVEFNNTSCSKVSSEIQSRLSGAGGWQDPFNANGGYLLVSDNGQGVVDAKWFLMTGGVDARTATFVDYLRLSFVNLPNSCLLISCAVSLPPDSSLGTSCNYCNLHNLYCGSDEGCSPLRYDFSGSYTEEYADCAVHNLGSCNSNGFVEVASSTAGSA